MKKSQALLLSVVLLTVLFASGLWFQTHRFLPSEKLHESLIQKLQTVTGSTVKYQSVQVGYLPQPKLVFGHVQMTFADHPLVVEAEKIQFDFNILPLLFGRVEPSAFYAQSGKAQTSLPGLAFFNPVRFENFSLRVGAVRPRIPIPFYFTTALAGKPEALVMKGHVVLDSVDEWNWEKTSAYVQIDLKQLSLEDTAGLAPDPKRPFLLKGGQIDTSVEIKKKAHEVFLELNVDGSAKGLSYEVLQGNTWIALPKLDAGWKAAAAWNNDTTELKLHKGVLKLPFGEIEANGSMKWNTGEIEGVHVAGSDMALEDILKYWPALGKALPFDIGFSGPGKWALSMEGTLDHLSLHFGWDLAKALLSYGQFFTKPKDIPLDLSFDLLFQNGTKLGGDFAVKFKELSMKGNLKDLDLKTGQGQLNLITNKFSVNGWEQYIPALQSYRLGGEVKLMSNWRGDLRKLEKAEHIFNLTFDKVSWTVPDGPGFRNVSLSLDYSPLMLEGRQMQFEIGGSPVVADLKIEGLPAKPEAALKISAAEMKPQGILQAITAVWPHKENAAPSQALGRVKDFIQTISPKDQSFKNVLLNVLYQKNAWNVPSFQFEGYGGKAEFKGALNLNGKEPSYNFEGGVRGMDLGLFLGREDPSRKALEGTLDLQGSVTGSGWGPEAWKKSLTGQGEWTLKNGKFLTFDLKDALSTIEPLQDLGKVRSSLKDFNKMNFKWKLAEGKATTDNFLVESPDYVLDGEGTLGFDGLANFRTDVFLSIAVAAKLVPNLASSLKKNPQAHWGPIPMLFSGSLLTPELKPVPAPVAELKSKIQKGKAKDFLCEIVTE